MLLLIFVEIVLVPRGSIWNNEFITDDKLYWSASIKALWNIISIVIITIMKSDIEN
jgi:hypothetical protein